jgi:hypothetical protein
LAIFWIQAQEQKYFELFEENLMTGWCIKVVQFWLDLVNTNTNRRCSFFQGFISGQSRENSHNGRQGGIGIRSFGLASDFRKVIAMAFGPMPAHYYSMVTAFQRNSLGLVQSAVAFLHCTSVLSADSESCLPQPA